MNAIIAKQKVDINAIVYNIRQDRMGMIQHTSQYKFAYQASVNFARQL
jgi:protein tyrosine phosphatase